MDIRSVSLKVNCVPLWSTRMKVCVLGEYSLKILCWYFLPSNVVLYWKNATLMWHYVGTLPLCCLVVIKYFVSKAGLILTMLLPWIIGLSDTLPVYLGVGGQLTYLLPYGMWLHPIWRSCHGVRDGVGEHWSLRSHRVDGPDVWYAVCAAGGAAAPRDGGGSDGEPSGGAASAPRKAGDDCQDFARLVCVVLPVFFARCHYQHGPAVFVRAVLCAAPLAGVGTAYWLRWEHSECHRSFCWRELQTHSNETKMHDKWHETMKD